MKNVSILIICTIILSYNINGQINDDPNYNIVLNEEFDGINRKWNEDTFTEDCDNPLWKCLSGESWWMGVVTNNINHHQAYQTRNAVFGNDGKMRLISEFISETPLVEDDYDIPSPYEFDIETNSKGIYYFSGTIETSTIDYHFGYYELKASLPIHDGGCSAFWLWGDSNTTYEEIDIYEHTIHDSSGDLYRGFSCGIWYNSEGCNYSDNDSSQAINFAKHYYNYSINQNDLSHEHTFACEWLPDRVTWFFDGQAINECKDKSQIPQNQKKIKVTYPINKGALNETCDFPVWRDGDTLTISHLKYFALKTDCSNDLSITSNSQISNMDYKVKRSIIIGSPDNVIVVPQNINFTLRAVDSITINGSFELPLGTEMTLIVHECPDCNNY